MYDIERAALSRIDLIDRLRDEVAAFGAESLTPVECAVYAADRETGGSTYLISRRFNMPGELVSFLLSRVTVKLLYADTKGLYDV